MLKSSKSYLTRPCGRSRDLINAYYIYLINVSFLTLNKKHIFVTFQWVLHDWGHEECVKILKNCRKAVPPREEGGKVIIIDIVVGAGQSDSRHKEMQALFDLYIMVVNGMERDEQEWKKIFLEAGFSDYKITPVLGVRSIIEVYP